MRYLPSFSASPRHGAEQRHWQSRHWDARSRQWCWHMVPSWILEVESVWRCWPFLLTPADLWTWPLQKQKEHPWNGQLMVKKNITNVLNTVWILRDKWIFFLNHPVSQMYVCEYYLSAHNIVNLHQRKAAVDVKLHSWANLDEEQKHRGIS